MENKFSNPYRLDKNITGVPTNIFPYVLDFCRSIVTNGIPLYVPVQPALGVIEAECFPNVEEVVKKYGGRSIIGWQIWEWYGVMIEAEFHAVWMNPKGFMVDVTPKALPFERILFLPDDTAKYVESQVNNIRRSLVRKMSSLDEFIDIANRKFELLNKGNRATQREIKLPVEENAEWRTLGTRAIDLQIKIIQTIPGRNDLCRCGSGKKFKKCHDKICFVPS
jgi:hypothetical protein